MKPPLEFGAGKQYDMQAVFAAVSGCGAVW